MKLSLLIVLLALSLLAQSAVAQSALAQSALQTEMRDGVIRAMALHAMTGRPVTERNPAMPGEALLAVTSSMSASVTVMVGATPVTGYNLNGALIWFALPVTAAGEFTEISIVDGSHHSLTATIPVVPAATDPTQLAAAEVDQLVQRAAAALDNSTLAIAVVDRAGRPLAIYRKGQATDSDVEDALSVARTSALFSNNQAPLSSRTIDSISQDHFPAGIPNQAAGDLYGIQHTNRGCDYQTTFVPGAMVPRPLNAAGDGYGEGVNTAAGSVPLYRNGTVLIGGIGAAGVPPALAEFAVVAATAGTPFFVQQPLPAPGAVFINGIRLPFASQTARPAGTAADSAPAGFYQIVPRDGAAAPDGWLVAPKDGASLSSVDVNSIIANGIAMANLTRATIRLPLGSRTKMVFAVTDLNGDILGAYRMPDATFFSVDVAISKARNVVYFSGSPADLPGLPAGTAVTNRTIGFGAQPFFPSGIDNSTPGPFRSLFLFDAANPCTQGNQPSNPYQSGVVFFPGSSPLYKNGRLVGGLGVSGDGVAQDDYVTSGAAVGFEAPTAIRADQVFIRGVRMPYWTFPRNPQQ